MVQRICGKKLQKKFQRKFEMQTYNPQSECRRNVKPTIRKLWKDSCKIRAAKSISREFKMRGHNPQSIITQGMSSCELRKGERVKVLLWKYCCEKDDAKRKMWKVVVVKYKHS